MYRHVDGDHCATALLNENSAQANENQLTKASEQIEVEKY